MRKPVAALLSWACLLTASLSFAIAAFAQAPSPDAPPKLNIADELPGFGAPGLGGFGSDEKIVLKAHVQSKDGGPDGEVVIEGTLEPHWHVYSVTQPPKGPLRTKIEVLATPPLEVKGAFKPDQPAKTRTLPDIYPGVKIEEHYDAVVWRAPVRLPAGVNPDQYAVKVKVAGQVCVDDGACIPILTTLEAKLVGFKAVAATRNDEAPPSPASDAAAPPPAPKPFAGKPGPYKASLTHGSLTGYVTPSQAKPGDTVKLIVSGTTSGGYHFYVLSDKPAAKGLPYRPTIVGLDLPTGWKRLAPEVDKKPEETSVEGKPVVYYEGDVTWTIPIQIPADAKAGTVEWGGVIGFQTCKSSSCDAPTAAEFRVSLEVSDSATGANKAELLFAGSSYTKAEKLLSGVKPAASATHSTTSGDSSRGSSSETPPTPSSQPTTESARKWNVEFITGDAKNASLGSVLVLAFVGGFLLNFMPCVLPVIGLKVMSFVNQAHGDRRQVFMLNLYYFCGLLAVFLVLASMAAVFRLSWGEQFQSTGFNVALVSVVFVFALSMLGVWEIPLPGFVGSGKAAEAAEQEGPTGAFLKGALTTVLATPCTGPFMGTALAWATKQPTPIIFLTFAALGLGMGFPYLLIGTFPSFLRFLPKPGAWMDTFKQVMGFVLMGTVVFIFSFLEQAYVVPTAGLLLGLALGCWWIGKTPVYAEWSQKLTATVIGGVMAVGVAGLGLLLFGPNHSELKWETYSRPQIEQLVSEGNTVLVDFTADWCASCKVNERVVLNTTKSKELIESQGITVMKADMTVLDESTMEMRKVLDEFGVQGIPFLVIFSSDAEHAIALSGPITYGMLAEAIQKAGPSKNRPTDTLAGAQ